MDLSYLNHRHQISLAMAANAACERSRAVHSELAKAYAAEIASARFERRPEMAA
jgi:hypothetical protein